MTPYEAYTGKIPDGTNIRAFGTAAFLIYPKDKHPSAFQPRFQDNFVHVGIKGNSIYRLVNIKTLKEEWYADVKIDEYVYPAAKEPIFGQLKGRAKITLPDQLREPQIMDTATQPPGRTAAAPR